MPFGGTHSIDDYDTGTRAAAAGGTTCIVDFVIQQHPDGLRSSLEEWQERADGAAHVDYGFHIAITQADEGTFADMEPMVEEGICTFKVFLAYKGVLMVTDDLFLRVLERTRDLGALDDGPLRERLGDRRARGARAGRRPDRPDPPRAHAPGGARGRGHPPLGAPRRAGRRGRLHRARDLRPGRRRDRRRPGARRGRVRRDLPAVPDQHVEDLERPDFEGARYVCSPPLREAHNQELLWTALDRGVLESVSTDHCPFNSEQKALGRDDFSKIPNGLAMIQHRLVKLWDLGVEGGRITPERAGRHDLHRDRAALRPRAQGRGRPRQGRRPGGLRPGHAVRVLHADLAHERGLRPVRGRDAPRAACATRSAAATLVYDRGEILTAARPRPLRAALARRAAAPRWPRDGRRPRPRGPARAGEPDRRARRGAARLLDRRVGRARASSCARGSTSCRWRSRSTRRATSGPSSRASEDGFVIVGLARGLGARRRLARRRARHVRRGRGAARAGRGGAAARRACGWSTGPTRRAPASGAACSAPRPAPARSSVDEVRDLRDRDGERLEDVVARYDVDLDRVHESGARLRGARAYLELHIEQGPVLESRGEPAATVLGHLRRRAPRGRVHGPGGPRRRHADGRCGATRSPPPPRPRWRSARSASGTSGVCTVGGATSEPGVVTAVAGRTEMLLDQRHLDPGRARRDARRGARGLRAGRRGPRLRGRARAPLVDPADPLRRPADRAGARGGGRGRRQGHRDPERPAARRRRDGAPDPDRDDLLAPPRRRSRTPRRRTRRRPTCAWRSRPTAARCRPPLALAAAGDLPPRE